MRIVEIRLAQQTLYSLKFLGRYTMEHVINHCGLNQTVKQSTIKALDLISIMAQRASA